MSERSGFRGGRRGKGRPSPYWRERRGPRQWDKPREEERPVMVMREGGEEEGQNHSTPEFSVLEGASGSGEARREKKFSNKARLFVGNLPRDFTEDELKKLFEPHGEVQEVYVHKEKSFGFVRMVSSQTHGACAISTGKSKK